MTRYILQRIGLALLTLFIIITIVYLLTAIFSENPFAERWLSMQDERNIHLQQELFDLSVKFHLVPNLPFEESPDWFVTKLNPIIRLSFWVQDVFNSETPFGSPFNESILTNSGVTTIPQFFFVFLRYTIIITLPAFILSASIGIFLGIIAGYKRGTIFDTIINGFALFFTALPSFVIAPIMITILLTQNVPPIFYILDDSRISSDGLGRIILSWLPPIMIIVLGSLSGYITYTRNQIITVLTSNYVLIAKSKGLGTVEIFIKYVLRNISIPLATILIPSYIGLLTGGIIIETYWRVPGVSRVIVNAFPAGEINLIMFNVVFFTTLGIFTTIVVDVSYVVLDPRIKYTAASKRSIMNEIKARLSRNEKFKKLNAEKLVGTSK